MSSNDPNSLPPPPVHPAARPVVMGWDLRPGFRSLGRFFSSTLAGDGRWTWALVAVASLVGFCAGRWNRPYDAYGIYSADREETGLLAHCRGARPLIAARFNSNGIRLSVNRKQKQPNAEEIARLELERSDLRRAYSICLQMMEGVSCEFQEHVNSEEGTYVTRPFPTWLRTSWDPNHGHVWTDAEMRLAIVTRAIGVVPREYHGILPATDVTPKWMIDAYMDEHPPDRSDLLFREKGSASLLLRHMKRMQPPACDRDAMFDFLAELEDWQKTRYRLGKNWKFWYTPEEAAELGIE